MNRFLHSNFARFLALIGSLTTIGVFWLPIKDKTVKLVAVGAFILLLLLLGYLQTQPEIEFEDPFRFTCKFCTGKGIVYRKKRAILCPCCDGFGDLRHEFESYLLGDCNLCCSTGRMPIKANLFCRCPLCKGYGIKPEFVSKVIKRKAG